MYVVRNYLLGAVLLGLGADLGCERAAEAPPTPLDSAEATARETFSGAVAEAIAAGPYTYFLLRVDDGDERWVVVADRQHRAAERLTVDTYGRRRGFVSRRLDRTFAVLYFGSVTSLEPRRGDSSGDD